jgi:putative Mg2+ transporter-C (MgtC) family protein
MSALNHSASILQVQARDRRTLRTTNFSSYFTEFTYSKGIFYGVVLIYVLAVSCVVLLDVVIASKYCNSSTFTESDMSAMKMEYTNPSYRYDPCQYTRYSYLLWLTRVECAFGRSLLASVLMGGIVGWERRMADRPAGIRTMALVSLGSCLFAINSTFGFIDGPMSWDSSRVAAAIPSGVGFLGAGLIFKEADKDHVTGDTTHVVHGLTTAASLWIVSGKLVLPFTLSISTKRSFRLHFYLIPVLNLRCC